MCGGGEQTNKTQNLRNINKTQSWIFDKDQQYWSQKYWPMSVILVARRLKQENHDLWSALATWQCPDSKTIAFMTPRVMWPLPPTLAPFLPCPDELYPFSHCNPNNPFFPYSNNRKKTLANIYPLTNTKVEWLKNKERKDETLGSLTSQK